MENYTTFRNLLRSRLSWHGDSDDDAVNQPYRFLSDTFFQIIKPTTVYISTLLIELLDAIFDAQEDK